MKKVTTKNFQEVLGVITKRFVETNDKNEKKCWIDSVNDWLDELRDNDFFGTEGQLDPRGDNRN